MWVLITKRMPPVPPQISRFNMLEPDAPPNYGIFLDHPMSHYVDLDLRNAITSCMKHRPEDRPDIADLVRQAQVGTARAYEGETDDMIRGWVRKLVC